MSLELLLLLAVFVLLPLIQQLVGATRRRNRRPSERAERQSLGTPQPLAQTPRPPTLAVPPLPETTAHAASSDALPARDTAAPATLALSPYQSTGRSAVGLRHRHDLRRAIVLMAMLGPCRAMDPYDGPERAGRQ